MNPLRDFLWLVAITVIQIILKEFFDRGASTNPGVVGLSVLICIVQLLLAVSLIWAGSQWVWRYM